MMRVHWKVFALQSSIPEEEQQITPNCPHCFAKLMRFSWQIVYTNIERRMKAFDTVNHQILINKLEYYGIRGLAKDWFISYLSDRQQVVTVNNATSTKCNVSCGVPQGSVLGPLLFLLYAFFFPSQLRVIYFYLFGAPPKVSVLM